MLVSTASLKMRVSARPYAETSGHPPQRVTPGGPGGRWFWLHLAVLSTFAVAQQLFEHLAEAPELLIAGGNT